MATIRDVVPIRISRSVPFDAEFISFNGLPDKAEHFTIRFPTSGDSPPHEHPLVRIHSECMTGDVFGSERCDCGSQLTSAVDRCGSSGGVILYMRQEGRGIGLYNKFAAYLLQDRDHDTYAANVILGRGADERCYDSAVAMLDALGLSTLRLLTNNPQKVDALTLAGIHVVERVPTGIFETPANRSYLDAKRQIAGHILS